jgi:hypothetical protein
MIRRPLVTRKHENYKQKSCASKLKSLIVSIQKRGFLFEAKARGRRKSGAYTGCVSIFRRLSNAAIGQKGHFRMDTIYWHRMPDVPYTL